MARGIARAGWDLDLAHGNAREDSLYEILNLLRGDRIEVKSDGKARSTGYVFVERTQHGRPSGIQTTKADWWAFEVYDNVWVILPTETLRGLVRRAEDSDLCKRGGDGNNYEGVLVPLSWLVTAHEIAAAA